MFVEPGGQHLDKTFGHIAYVLSLPLQVCTYSSILSQVPFGACPEEGADAISAHGHGKCNSCPSHFSPFQNFDFELIPTQVLDRLSNEQLRRAAPLCTVPPHSHLILLSSLPFSLFLQVNAHSGHLHSLVYPHPVTNRLHLLAHFGQLAAVT